MVLRVVCVGLVVAAAAAVLLAAGPVRAEGPYVYGAPPIPYNYYVPGPGASGSAAALYVSPRPVPAYVGSAFITYQPLAPHEFLYKHCRVYHTHNPGAGWTRTVVSWE
jgi:hypothetical protein